MSAAEVVYELKSDVRDLDRRVTALEAKVDTVLEAIKGTPDDEGNLKARLLEVVEVLKTLKG